MINLFKNHFIQSIKFFIFRLPLENKMDFCMKNGCKHVCFTHTKASESALYTSKGKQGFNHISTYALFFAASKDVDPKGINFLKPLILRNR
jgi:hypothetical protein